MWIVATRKRNDEKAEKYNAERRKRTGNAFLS